jgi:hypothetical protein
LNAYFACWGHTQIRFGTFASLDFRISRQFAVHLGQLTGFVEVINITNRDNPCCIEYGAEEGPNGNLTINQKTEYLYPIIPSIGLRHKPKTGSLIRE